MSATADFSDDSGDGTLRFTGELVLARLGNLPQRLDAIADDRRIGRLDLSAVDRIDTIGAWIVHRFAVRHQAEIDGLDPDGKHLLDEVAAADEPVEHRPAHQPGFQRVLGEIGDAVFVTFHTLHGLLGFFGGTAVASWNVMRHRERFRFNAVVQQFEAVGVSALAIIGLMSFLIGMVIAQQGAVQLAQFGAQVFTINLVGRLTLREMGILMTAIMVAGRSGSAFAAQLGTMKLTEEIDAMRTIGVSPMEALVVPRVVASTIMMILLGFYSSLLGIIGGGLLTWVTLDIPLVTFIQRIREVVPITDVYIGLIKAPVFGLIIAIAGCFQGMQVEADAEQVGKRTTSAVVQSIFLVIVLDAFFAVFFSSIGWN